MTALLAVCMPLAVSAQHHVPETSSLVDWEEACSLCEEGHYYAAGQLLSKYIKDCGSEGKSFDARYVADANALKLVCDYYLDSKSAAEDIADFIAKNPTSRFCRRLELLRANVLVRKGSFKEAISVYRRVDKESVPAAEREEALLYESVAYINTGDMTRAKAMLSLLNGAKKHQMDVVFYSAYVKYAEGDYDGAISDFEVCKNAYGYSHKVPVYLADCYLQKGDVESAMRCVTGFRETYPNSELASESKRVEGEVCYEQGNLDKAIVLLSGYVQQETVPKRSALYRLGMSYFKTARYADAAQMLSRSASNNRDEMAQNAWLHSGISYVNLGSKKQASMAFQQASEMSYDKAVQEEALYNYSLSLHDGGTMGFGEAVNVFERFLNNYPNSKYKNSVSQHLTEVYFTTKNYPAALASINKIKNPGSQILAAKQRVLLNMSASELTSGRMASAADYATRAISVGKYDTQALADAYYWRGEANYRQGKYAEAYNDYRMFVNTSADKGSNYHYANYCMGYALFKQKKYQQAKPWFAKYVSQAKDDKGRVAVLSDAYNRLGDCCFDSRSDDEAYDAYRKAYETDASQGDYSLLQLAMISGIKGNYADKINLIAQMNEQYGSSQYGDDAMYEQGRAYIQSGDKAKAIETFDKITQTYPNSVMAAKAYNELGTLYSDGTQTQKAIDAYKAVVEKFPNSMEAQTALSSLKDIYTENGRISEYASIASKAGKSLSPEELDGMVLAAARRGYDAGKLEQAITYYKQLREQTQTEDMRLVATVGEMRCAYGLKRYDDAVRAASDLIADSKVGPEEKSEAMFVRAESYYVTGKPAEAVADWQTLSADSRTEYGAQANVRLAEYAFNTNQYKAAEDLLVKFIDSGTPHAYWLARGFILLADVYNKTDRQVEAEQYLLSLKSNYSENEEINKMIEERMKEK